MDGAPVAVDLDGVGVFGGTHGLAFVEGLGWMPEMARQVKAGCVPGGEGERLGEGVCVGGGRLWGVGVVRA
jgi:hypothetical protein